MEDDILIYKNLALKHWHNTQNSGFCEVKAMKAPPKGQEMTLKLIACLLTSGTVQNNQILFSGCKGWRLFLQDTRNLYLKIEEFINNLDKNAKDKQYSEKMEDLKSRIKTFNEEIHDYWDLDYHNRVSKAGHTMVKVLDILIKLWDLKYMENFIKR